MPKEGLAGYNGSAWMSRKTAEESRALMKGGFRMAVTVIPVSARLQLRLQAGFDEEMNPIYRTRTFSNVKPSAGNEDLYELGDQLGGLQIHSVEAIRRIDEVELEEE